jgi:hypothetical protein
MSGDCPMVWCSYTITVVYYTSTRHRRQLLEGIASRLVQSPQNPRSDTIYPENSEGRPVCKFKDPAILIAHVSLNPVGANGWANAWTEGSI